MTTGEIAPVKDTPMDFTTPKAVGKEINNYDFVQLKNGKGYDHNWVLNTKGDLSQVAAKLTSPESGITLEVYTTIFAHDTNISCLVSYLCLQSIYKLGYPVQTGFFVYCCCCNCVV